MNNFSCCVSVYYIVYWDLFWCYRTLFNCGKWPHFIIITKNTRIFRLKKILKKDAPFLQSFISGGKTFLQRLCSDVIPLWGTYMSAIVQRKLFTSHHTDCAEANAVLHFIWLVTWKKHARKLHQLMAEKIYPSRFLKIFLSFPWYGLYHWSNNFQAHLPIHKKHFFASPEHD